VTGGAQWRPQSTFAAICRIIASGSAPKDCVRKTIWLPDTRSPEFAERVRRESLALRGRPSEDEALDWIEDAMADDEA
jgi:hypothetical protein